MKYPNKITGYISKANYEEATKNADFISCSHCLVGLALQDMGYEAYDINVGVYDMSFSGNAIMPHYYNIDDSTALLIKNWANNEGKILDVFPHEFTLTRKVSV